MPWEGEAGKPALTMPIREANSSDIATLAMLISTSYQDVARQFGLNRENCPTHPSFCTEAWVQADLARGQRYFLVEENGQALGCAAYERRGDGRASLNRLAVLPEHRASGLGSRLVKFIIDLAASEAVTTLWISVIGEHAALQRWYRERGFRSDEVRHFAHLPFSVQYMTCDAGG